MEIDAGFDLFDRSSRSPSLTKEGKILLREIKAVLKSHDHLVKKVDSLIRQVDNEVKIAFDELSFPRDVLLKILTDFEAKFPTTSLLLLNCSHNEAYRLVQAGKADLAITLAVQDYPEGVLFKGFTHVHYSSVVGMKHELANTVALGPEELAQFRHIRITDSNAGFRTYDSDLSTNIWFSDTSSMMVDLVSQGFGWADLPVHLFKHRTDIKKLATRHQAVNFIQNVDMVWSHDAALGIAGEWLTEELSRVGKTLI
jgi:DNA-binding transcriptional LysR family regulator